MTHLTRLSHERTNMTLAELVKGLNENDFKAFPQKKDPKRLTISAIEDGNRFFISRSSVGQNEDGTAKYAWIKGKQWQEQQ